MLIKMDLNLVVADTSRSIAFSGEGNQKRAKTRRMARLQLQAIQESVHVTGGGEDDSDDIHSNARFVSDVQASLLFVFFKLNEQKCGCNVTSPLVLANDS